MSEENNASTESTAGRKADGMGTPPENSSADSAGIKYFDSLIEDFDISTACGSDEPPKPGLNEFSRFFNDAAAFGGGFESTIDKPPEEIDRELAGGETKLLDFKLEGDKITTPVTDENGMIVIFDEEAGIDATSAAIPESVDRFLAERVPDENEGAELSEEAAPPSHEETGTAAVSNESEALHLENPEDNYSRDRNMDDPPVSPAHENAAETAPEKKRPVIAGLLPWSGDSVGEVIRKLVFLISAGVFIGAGIMLIGTLQDSEVAVEEQESLKSMISTTAATSVIIDESAGTTSVVTVPPTTEERISHAESLMQDFVEVKGNVKGILEMPSLELMYPVVQGTDNEYYLTHTYDDRRNRAGAIFMDYRCTYTPEYVSPNIVLYGHNQNDGTMFGRLKYYKNNVDFYKGSPMISFNTDFEAGDYVIFAYFISNVHDYQDSSGEVFHYHDYIETLNDERTFNWYMSEVAERNQIISPVDVVFGDRLLVLSTCSSEYNDSRFVVMARKLRPGESYYSFNFKSAALNPFAKQIDWDAILAANSSKVSVNTPALASAIGGAAGNADSVLADVYRNYENSFGGSVEEISDSNTSVEIINENDLPGDIPVSQEQTETAASSGTSATAASGTSATASSETSATASAAAVQASVRITDVSESGQSETGTAGSETSAPDSAASDGSGPAASDTSTVT